MTQNRLLAFFMMPATGFSIAMIVNACTPHGQAAAGELATSKVSCVLANLGEPWQRVAEKCIVSPGDFDRYERIFSEGQRAMAVAKEDERKRVAAQGCVLDGGR